MNRKKTVPKKPAKRRTKPELYFVIGGGINRTKCATAADALAHATRLLQEKNPAAVWGADYSTAGGDKTIFVTGRHMGKSLHIQNMAEMVAPKLERQQCQGQDKPLYIVKVVGVVEIAPPPVILREPTKDEMP